ncbi:MAG: Stk1 family PASTA domain-containing Ser/Thr kinase [Clostridia bacterium]|nr:Stk1 family PASTA domain-containing Ser/Thr kinase [Clostridia bacterium]
MMKGMVFADRYRLVDFIGQGGMSLVYRAVDIRTGHSVAIKILKTEYNSDKEFLERFQREAQAASLMSHHNIVNLLDVGVEGEHRYLVLEYVSGNTLKEVIQQKGQLNVNTAIQITVRILSALQHAHDNGIIHRDIKPQNVLVHSDGHVKVADFGIARMTNAFTISKGDTVVGSVHYSSPEQATGSVVEATSDIYSTGVVLYEMLTGRVPFVGDTPVSVAMQHINSAPPPIENLNPDVPPAVVAVVMKALEKSPAKRYQSAREMADALIRARDGKDDPGTPAVPNNSQGAQRTGPKPAVKSSANHLRKHTDFPTGRYSVRRRTLNKLVRWGLTLFMAAAVFTVLVLGIRQIYSQVANRAVAPELVGLTLSDAQALARREGLNLQVTEVSDSQMKGTVLTQIPEVDTEMRKGDSLLLTVSKGPETLNMPDVVGLTKEEAQQKLKEKGLSMVAVKIASTEPAGTILSQKPGKDESCTVGQEVEVTLSGGSTLVPDLTGLPWAEAQQLLQTRASTGWSSVAAFLSQPTLQKTDTATARPWLAVHSERFIATFSVVMGNARYQQRSLLQKQGRTFSVVQRRYGIYWVADE